MHRRVFLRQMLKLTTGAWFGLNGLSRAMALAGAPLRGAPPRMAIIIDDFGASIRRAQAFLQIPLPLTFAILPHLKYSVELAHAIHAQNREILLHQPMEPFDPHLNPGPGALYVGDSAERIAEVVTINIHSLPFISGVNNHMGSRFTSRPGEIRNALETINHCGLFFVDSLTSHQSRAYAAACSIHMPAARRDTFLDNRRNPEAILSRLYELVERAMGCGSAVGIGHPWPETEAAIQQFADEIADAGIEVVPISVLI
jgi:polysaccharide deacetylase 2 family uncharacterized protein YibQ